MLVKVRVLDLVNPKAEVGKERLPVEVVESSMYIDPERIMSLCMYPEHKDEYMDPDQLRMRNAINKKCGKHKLCRINTRDGYYFGNVILEDILPHLQINENGLQRNVEGQMS